MVLVKAHGRGATAQHSGFNAVKSFLGLMIAEAKRQSENILRFSKSCCRTVRQIP